MDQTFPKQKRVRKSRDFDRVYGSSRFAADGTLVVNVCENGLQESRLGLSIGRKVGNAVVRNRWKRQIREAFRTQAAAIPAGWDIVVRPRKGAVLEHDSIRRSLIKLVKRAASAPRDPSSPNRRRP